MQLKYKTLIIKFLMVEDSSYRMTGSFKFRYSNLKEIAHILDVAFAGHMLAYIITYIFIYVVLKYIRLAW